MKALTLHQPWASLIACGRKRIETRSWKTDYRGPLAIHAGKGTWNPLDFPGRIEPDALGQDVYWLPEPWTEEEQVAAGLPPDGDLCGFPLPLGAVVATCTLGHCIPMVLAGSGCQDAHVRLDPEYTMTAQVLIPDPAGRCGWAEPVDISDQLPFGDFGPGRWAWMLAEIRAVWPPIPARGRQGCWEWEKPV